MRMEFQILSFLRIGILLWGVLQLSYNLFLHPLRKFPGPVAARASGWWKTWVEVVRGKSWVDVLVELHRKYGTCSRSYTRYLR